MTVSIIEPVNNYAGNSSTVTFDFDFYIEDETQLDVYLTDNTGAQSKLIYGADYSIHEFKNKNGSYITYPLTGSSHTVLKEDETISLILNLPVQQDKEYKNSSKLYLDTLEYSFDYLTRLLQIFKRQLSRALKVQEGTDINTDALAQSLRITADNIDNINTVKENISDVNTVSESISDVNAVSDSLSAVNTVSSNINAVNTVSSISSAVSNVSNISSAVSTVSANASNINTVSDNISSINTVSGISSAVSNVSNISSAVSAVSANASNIDTVSDNISSVNTVSGSISNVNAAGSSISNINTVSGALLAVNNVSSNISAVNAVSGSISAVNAVSDDLANINTAAAHLTNIDNAAIWAEGSDEAVSAIGGEHSAKGWAMRSENAHTALDNLTPEGRAKFQYAPFSINSGSIDSSGNNNTLHLPDGSSGDIEVQFVQPVLTSNGTMGGNEFAVSGTFTIDGSVYQLFNGASSLIASNIPASITFYNPDALKVSSLTVTQRTDMHQVKDWRVSASNDGSSWTLLNSGRNSSTASIINLPVNSADFYNYYKLEITSEIYTPDYSYISLYKLTVNAVYLEHVSRSSDLICAPCTITTADGKTKTFNAYNVLNINENPSNPIANYTVIGSPVISSDFIASGFNSSNYLTTGEINLSSDFIFISPIFNISSIPSIQSDIVFSSETNSLFELCVLNSGRLKVLLKATSDILRDETLSINLNTNYQIKLVKEGNNYYVYYKTEVSDWILLKTTTSNESLDIANLKIGMGGVGGNYPFYDSIDLKAFKIYIDGELEYSAVNQADGDYKVMKSYEDGSLKLVNSLAVQKTQPAAPAEGDLWLDNSKNPLILKQYDNSEWAVNNDLVYIGDAAVSGGVITAVKSSYFNACPAYRHPAETYQNGSSWYEVYSDGWIRQGGNCSTNTAVTFVKKFASNDYTLSCASSAKTASGFTSAETGSWTAEGYIG